MNINSDFTVWFYHLVKLTMGGSNIISLQLFLLSPSSRRSAYIIFIGLPPADSQISFYLLFSIDFLLVYLLFISASLVCKSVLKIGS